MDRSGRSRRYWCLGGPGGARQSHLEQHRGTGIDGRHRAEHGVVEHGVVESGVVEHGVVEYQRRWVPRRGGADRQYLAVPRAVRGIMMPPRPAAVGGADRPAEAN